MGREAAVTLEQVIAAASAIKGEGGKPTSRSIRERLGNMGSMGTINKMLQSWKAGQVRQIDSSPVLPVSVQRVIMDHLDQELAGAQAKLMGELAEQQQECSDLATENERQGVEIEAQARSLDALSIGKAAAEGRVVQLSADLEKLREDTIRERQAAEAARTELAKVMLRLEAMPRLEGDLAALREALENEREARVTAERSAAVLLAQKTDLDGRLVDAKSQNEHMGEELAKVRDRAEKIANDLADARVTVQTSKARIEAQEREIAENRRDVEVARGEAKSIGEQAAELRGRLSTKE
ncbi:MAG: DNA-binding protein [Pseudomonadota bacterium]|nr:DNA-binding protein [Pseudomonadota bacterium]MDP1904179.1 DNA-binding protein [Pseudomonadota bacterium]